MWNYPVFLSLLLILVAIKSSVQESSDNVRKFVYDYLHRDGVFVLRMVSSHAGIIFGTDLILELWRTFYGIEKKVSTSDFLQPWLLFAARVLPLKDP